MQSRLALFSDEEADLSEFAVTDLRDLLTAEYVKSRGPETDREKAGQIMAQLLDLCRRYWRNPDGNLCHDKERLQLDSLFFIKFLLEKGVEK